MAASTVRCSMSNMSGGGSACEEGVWPPQPSGTSPIKPKVDGKMVPSKWGGAEPAEFLGPTSSSSFACWKEELADPLCGSAPSGSPSPAACRVASGSSPCTNPSPASCNREEEDDEEKDEEEEDEEEASIFSSLGEEPGFPEEVGAGSGDGGSCSVPGSISDEESRVSVSEVLVGVSASWWSDLDSTQVGSVDEEGPATQSTAAIVSLSRSSSLLNLRLLTGVASSSSTGNNHTYT